MSSITPSRRSVLRTAAWTAPVVAVATAAPAFATSGASFREVTTDALPFAAAIPGLIDLGDWTVTLTSRVPVNLPVGTVVPAPDLTAVVTIPDAARAQIASLGPERVSGTATALYPVEGQPAPLEANLTIPLTTLPASGDAAITTTGRGASFTAGAAGTFNISLDTITTNLTLDPPALGSIAETSVVLSPKAGQDYTFATFTVA